MKQQDCLDNFELNLGSCKLYSYFRFFLISVFCHLVVEIFERSSCSNCLPFMLFSILVFADCLPFRLISILVFADCLRSRLISILVFADCLPFMFISILVFASFDIYKNNLHLFNFHAQALDQCLVTVFAYAYFLQIEQGLCLSHFINVSALHFHDTSNIT